MGNHSVSVEALIISSIVAVGEKRAIGLQGSMCWNYPSEYQHFLNTVSGHHILLGRINWESNLSNIKLLSRVTSLVVSKNAEDLQRYSNRDFDHHFFSDIKSAISFARNQNEKELFIIGGEKIYQQSMQLVDRIYYSQVPYKGRADTFFPEIDQKKFKITKNFVQAANHNSPEWRFALWERLSS